MTEGTHHYPLDEQPPLHEEGLTVYAETHEPAVDGTVRLIGEAALATEASSPLADAVETIRVNRVRLGRQWADGEVASPYEMSRALMEPVFSQRLNALLHEADYTPAELSGLLKEIQAAQQYAGKVDEDYHSSGLISGLLETVPDEKLQETYHSRLDKDSGALKRWIRGELDGDVELSKLAGMARLVGRLYDQSPVELINDERAMRDPIVRKLVEEPGYNLLLTASLPREPEPGESNRDFEVRMRAAGERILARTGLPQSMLKDIHDSVYYRTLKKDKEGMTIQGEDRGIDMGSFKRFLTKTIENINEVGVDTVMLLRERCGYRNLDNYTPAQMLRMRGLVEGDPDVIEHIKAGDSTVVFADGSGDHNHASARTAEIFDTDSGRGIFFEINAPGDFLRYMSLLKARGIAPSTLVWTAHGAPGTMIQGVGDNIFYITNREGSDLEERRTELQKTEDVPVVSLHESRALLQKIANEMMQDSRGIDDDATAVGRRRVFLKSCSQALPRIKLRDTHDGSTVEIEESTVEALASVINDPGVDIYGVDRPASMKRKGSDIIYYDYLTKTPYTATKAVVNRFGAVTTTKVDTVPLRRPSRSGYYPNSYAA